jgi:hypothetical protein
MNRKPVAASSTPGGEKISRLGLLMASFGLIPLIVGFMLVSQV